MTPHALLVVRDKTLGSLEVVVNCEHELRCVETTYVLGRKGGTDWAADAVSSCCLGDDPFAALRVVRVYDILH